MRCVQGYIYSCSQALVVKKRVWYKPLAHAQSYFDHLHTLLYYGQFQFTAEGHTSDGNLPNSELGVHKQCIPVFLCPCMKTCEQG